MKCSVSKGDKKRKKQVVLESAQLEAELEEKHKKDLVEFRNNKQSSEVGLHWFCGPQAVNMKKLFQLQGL